jgi:hypothetical protein
VCARAHESEELGFRVRDYQELFARSSYDGYRVR